MELNVEKELAALKTLSAKELKQRYAELWDEVPNTHNRTWLTKRIIWRMQALAEGDLSERARRRAAELANDADIRRRPLEMPATVPAATVRTLSYRAPSPTDRRLPPPGSSITRDYKGATLEVRVLAAGFEYEGEKYRTLSAVAKKISGSHCNGYLFFGLTKGGGQ